MFVILPMVKTADVTFRFAENHGFTSGPIDKRSRCVDNAIMDNQSDPHQFTRDAWEANADVWDARMGDDGNDFFNTLCWTPLASLLDPQPGQHILDIACGNGLTSRRLAALGAQVTAFDFSANLIEKANARENPNSLIDYHVIDATNEQQLLSWVKQRMMRRSPTWRSSIWPISKHSSRFAKAAET